MKEKIININPASLEGMFTWEKKRAARMAGLKAKGLTVRTSVSEVPYETRGTAGLVFLSPERVENMVVGRSEYYLPLERCIDPKFMLAAYESGIKRLASSFGNEAMYDATFSRQRPKTTINMKKFFRSDNFPLQPKTPCSWGRLYSFSYDLLGWKIDREAIKSVASNAGISKRVVDMIYESGVPKNFSRQRLIELSAKINEFANENLLEQELVHLGVNSLCGLLIQDKFDVIGLAFDSNGVSAEEADKPYHRPKISSHSAKEVAQGAMACFKFTGFDKLGRGSDLEFDPTNLPDNLEELTALLGFEASPITFAAFSTAMFSIGSEGIFESNQLNRLQFPFI